MYDYHYHGKGKPPFAFSVHILIAMSLRFEDWEMCSNTTNTTLTVLSAVIMLKCSASQVSAQISFACVAIFSLPVGFKATWRFLVGKGK